MAKKTKDVKENPQSDVTDATNDAESAEKQEEKKKGGVFQWILFVGVIPLMFAIMVALIILFVADINVFDSISKAASKIPFVSTLVGESDKDTANIQEVGEKVVELQATNKEYAEQIEALNKNVDEKNQLIKDLNKEITALKTELQKREDKIAANEVKVDELVKTYESMSPKKAAELIEFMDEEDAIVLLSRMKNSTLTAVLEKMTPETAAKLSLAIAKLG